MDYHIKLHNRMKIFHEGDAGCTANVCLITNHEIYVANAGDSRTVACIKGQTIPLSFDHKPNNNF